jgi:DNA modification methylase
MAPKKVIIGPAELWHGDCREVIPLLDPVDMIFTDPPYGHNNNNGDLILIFCGSGQITARRLLLLLLLRRRRP